jgi:dienelactone hydrolase
MLFLGVSVLAGCASPTGGPSITTTAPSGPSELIPTTVSRPDGSGPFPAIVILHDCSGLGPASSGAPERWSKELVSRGYVVVIPDSFTTRGRPGGVCTDASPGRADVGPGRRVRDAYAALAHARALSFVDGRRVGLMGGSHGGSTTLLSMLAPDSESDSLAREKRAGFRAAVALYPRCGTRLGGRAESYRPVAPLLILIGEKDDWTPAEACQRLAAGARAAGYPVTITVYPDAHHSFDSDRPLRFVAARVNPASPTGRGATTGGNPAAWAASIRDALAFFAEHLQ